MSSYTSDLATGKSSSTPIPLQIPQPLQTVTEQTTEAPTTASQVDNSAQPGHSFGKIGVHYGQAPAIQPKLTVGPVNDQYEQEADHVAAQVVGQVNSPTTQRQEMSEEEEELQTKPLADGVQRQATPEDEEELQTKLIENSIQRQEVPEEEEEIQTKALASTVQRQEMPEEEEQLQTKPLADSIQRQETPEEEELQTKPQIQRQADGSTAAPPAVEGAIHQARGSGQALSDATRQPMERAFGADFSRVKVHTDTQADQLNRSIQARAFTTGSDIFFRQGEHSPGTRAGQELLAHELTHVVQQSAHHSPLAVSRANVVQRYFDQGYLTSTWRQADDLTMAIKTGYPNHEFYASAGKVATANTKLKAVNSGIELIETGKEDTFWEGSRVKPTRQAKLKKVEAKNKKNTTQGDDMLLYADCGKSNAAVVGGEDRQAVYDKPGAGGASNTKVSGSPQEMKIAIIKAWMEHEKTTVNPPEAMAITLALTNAEAKKLDLQPLVNEYIIASTPIEKEAIKTRYKKKLEEVADAYWDYYNKLPTTRREHVDAALKINRYARPSVGQGYTTSSGGPSAGKATWNFHWGGVVMASNDDKDNAVLENYAVGDPTVENKLWTFDIYGTQKKGQTFHERHTATQQHGTTPTTMTVEKK